MADNSPPLWISETPADVDELEMIGRELLLAIGEDIGREGLRDTPRRFAAWWGEFINYDPGRLDTAFETVTTDQLVAVTGMRVWSLCEHHLLPFWADVSVGYIATDRVLGLSKFARIAQKHAHRLQLQERLVHDIADEVQELTGSANVGVVARGVHLCMAMRGVKTDATMVTSVLRGMFRDDARTRAEFMTLADAPARG